MNITTNYAYGYMNAVSQNKTKLATKQTTEPQIEVPTFKALNKQKTLQTGLGLGASILAALGIKKATQKQEPQKLNTPLPKPEEEIKINIPNEQVQKVVDFLSNQTFERENPMTGAEYTFNSYTKPEIAAIADACAVDINAVPELALFFESTSDYGKKYNYEEAKDKAIFLAEQPKLRNAIADAIVSYTNNEMQSYTWRKGIFDKKWEEMKQHPDSVAELLSVKLNNNIRFAPSEVVDLAETYEKYPEAVKDLAAKTRGKETLLPYLHTDEIKTLAPVYEDFKEIIDYVLKYATPLEMLSKNYSDGYNYNPAKELVENIVVAKESPELTVKYLPKVADAKAQGINVSLADCIRIAKENPRYLDVAFNDLKKVKSHIKGSALKIDFVKFAENANKHSESLDKYLTEMDKDNVISVYCACDLFEDKRYEEAINKAVKENGGTPVQHFVNRVYEQYRVVERKNKASELRSKMSEIIKS